MRNKMPHIYGWLGLCHGPHLGSVPKALDGWGFATDPTWEVPQKLRRLGLSHGPHLGNLQHFLSSSWWGAGCWFPLQEFHPPLSALQASGPKRPALIFWTNWTLLSIYVPHRADDVRLSKLDDDGSTAELMARVTRVPVVVLCVTVDECIATATDAFYHTCAALHCCHVLWRHWNTNRNHDNNDCTACVFKRKCKHDRKYNSASLRHRSKITTIRVGSYEHVLHATRLHLRCGHKYDMATIWGGYDGSTAELISLQHSTKNQKKWLCCRKEAARCFMSVSS